MRKPTLYVTQVYIIRDLTIYRIFQDGLVKIILVENYI